MNLWRHSGALLAAGLLAPLGATALALRPDWRAGWRERLGAGGRPEAGAIWVHGASVGEILAASRLIDRLLEAGLDRLLELGLDQLVVLGLDQLVVLAVLMVE